MNPSDSTPGSGIRIRQVRLPEDGPGLLDLDTSFRTREILRVRVDDSGVSIEPERLSAPLGKRFALEEELGRERAWDEGFVAIVTGGPADPGASSVTAGTRGSTIPGLSSPPESGPDGDRVVGFLALRWEGWNRRAAIWHLYVTRDARRGGIGRKLLDEADAQARAAGLRCLWLEVTNVNLPAIRFYQRCGFRLCGLDASLYDPAGEAAGECALYLSRPIDPT